ncbi:MAG: cytochrome P450 [Planktomarina sp.]|nr:cytochrome P450 [Planktomarina sp.]
MKIFSQSPTEPNFVQNPYPAYDRARAMGDVVWWEDYNMPAAVSHRAVRMILGNRELGRQAPNAIRCPLHIAQWQENESHSMLELEPPRHSRLRGLVLRAFTGRKVAAMAPYITATCHRLINEFSDKPFDFLNAFARPLPVHVIASLLGVPTDRCDDLLRWSNAMVAMYQSGRSYEIELAANQATIDFTAFLESYITHRRTHPSEDLLSDLIAAEEAGEKLTGAELISTCILLLNAGHEATVHTLGNALKTILPLRYRVVTPELVEEVLRYDPPLHVFTRHAYKDIDCFGIKIKSGQEVACLLAAANRDPNFVDSPNHFDPFRKPSRHQSFGAGLHFCVGAPLARLEITIGLQTLFERRPDLQVSIPPEYAETYHFHGLKELMVQ